MSISQEYRDRNLYFHHSIDYPPNPSNFGMHVHEEFELLYFVSGSASCIVETNAYPMEPDSLLVIRPMESHKMRILDNKPYERFGIHFWPNLIDEIDPAGKLLEPFINHPLGQNNFYRSEEFHTIHPRDLYNAMSVPGLNNEERRTAILINLYPLLGQIQSAFSKKKDKSAVNHTSLYTEIAEYINLHLFEGLTVDSLCSRFFVSRSQLGRKFKLITGSSVWDYILHKRLVAAQIKIREGCQATEACLACGFRDYSSFYRAYVKKFGISPKKDTPTK